MYVAFKQRMGEAQPVPEVAPAPLTKDESGPPPLTKEESAKIHLGEGTETSFQKYKALFYSLRILRELVPALGRCELLHVDLRKSRSLCNSLL